MALTEHQDIPNKPVVNAPWTFRRLLGGGVTAVSTAFVKVFASPFEWILAFSVIVIAVGELTNANLSLFFYLFAFILLFCLIIKSIINSTPSQLSDAIEKEKKK